MQPAAPHAPVRARFPTLAACLVLLLLAFLSSGVGQQHVVAAPSGRLLDQTPQAAAIGATVSAGTGRRVPRWRAADRLGAVPLVLWQTFRTSQLPSAAQDLVNTWHHKNPGLLMRLHNDTQASRFINRTFSQEVQRVYAGFPLGVMRADMWRYAILYARGGESLWLPSCGLGSSESLRSLECGRARPPRHELRQPGSPFAVCGRRDARTLVHLLWIAQVACDEAQHTRLMASSLTACPHIPPASSDPLRRLRCSSFAPRLSSHSPLRLSLQVCTQTLMCAASSP